MGSWVEIGAFSMPPHLMWCEGNIRVDNLRSKWCSLSCKMFTEILIGLED